MASTVSFKNILLTRCIQIQLESETAICLFYWFCRFNKNIYIFVISKKKKKKKKKCSQRRFWSISLARENKLAKLVNRSIVFYFTKYNGILHNLKLLLFFLQIKHLQLAAIDGQEIGEISSIPNEELKEIDKEGIQYEITVLEEKLAQMKPNMTAIAEYRKKVSCFIIRMY